jgi:hypothetical protein
MNRYLMRMHDTGNELPRWMPVIAAARLNENILPEREALIRIVKAGVAESAWEESQHGKRD